MIRAGYEYSEIWYCEDVDYFIEFQYNRYHVFYDEDYDDSVSIYHGNFETFGEADSFIKRLIKEPDIFEDAKRVADEFGCWTIKE